MITIRAARMYCTGSVNYGRTLFKSAEIISPLATVSSAIRLPHKPLPVASIYTCTLRHYGSKKESNLERVYYGSLASRMKAVKVFSLTTSAMGLAAQPILIEQGMKMGGTPVAVFLSIFAGFFTFVTPLMLHFITKKYVTEIHYDPATDEYTAKTISLLLQTVHTKFRTTDVKVPDVPGMFTSFLIGDKALFVDPSLFEDPEHYVRMMGYDKPIDFKLDLNESPPEIEPKKETK